VVVVESCEDRKGERPLPEDEKMRVWAFRHSETSDKKETMLGRPEKRRRMSGRSYFNSTQPGF